MDMDRFNSMVARLEQESAHAPWRYRAKVVLLTLLGFGILALMLAAVGFGLALLGGFAVFLAFSGFGAIILLLKLGKLLFLLAVPLWFTLKSALQALFLRFPAPQGREITRAEAPALFAAFDTMRQAMHGPRFHHVLVVDEVNAAVVQRPAFGLVGWPRNYLLLGLPLLECLAPSEALAVVAHEYGHLAGAHGRFSAFIYRLRHTWSTVQAYVEHFQGWLARLVAPLVRWYAPYFNAYTFVLARTDEYRADAASARLVGPRHMGHALKRVNLIAPHHRDFMQQAYARADDEPIPPADLMQRWADLGRTGEHEAATRRWLDEALDREGHFTDTHPTLRARLAALPAPDTAGAADTNGAESAVADAMQALPPLLDGQSASQAWFGAALDGLRTELQQRWIEHVAEGWRERHDKVQADRARLHALREMPERDTATEFEMLHLAMRHEPDADPRAELARFNAANADHAGGLFLEGMALLDKDDETGLARLDRAMALDADAIKPACERAFAFLTERKESARAETYAARWRERDAQERGGG
jgi:Zn-dependent protease with chaperone function